MSDGYNTKENNAEIAAAYDEIFKSIRDLLSLKLTLPLGNPALRNVHTNQFLWYDLPPEFKLEYMETISKTMNSSVNRYAPYEEGKWYIEAVTITNDGKKFQMELELNPFPSSLIKYRDDYHSFIDAYTNLTKKSDGSSSSSVKSTENTTLKGGEGTYIDNLVKEICGNETDQLKKAKLVHNHIKSKQHYSSYSCSKYSSAEQCYKNITHLNCADMSRLTRAMMASAGLTCYVVHNNRGVGHFWVVIEINGKKYASDNASTATREFDYFWNPETGKTEKAVNGGKYYYNRGFIYETNSVSTIVKIPSITFKTLKIEFKAKETGQEFAIKDIEFSKLKVKQV